MSRMLILEDNEERQQTLRRRFPDAVIVATSPACIDHLAEHWDEIWLDHDLGGHLLEDGREDCGRLVVLYILENQPEHLKNTTFIVHSANTHRARGMAEDLQRAGYHAVCRSYINLLPELNKPPE
jgi:hypothetical protein